MGAITDKRMKNFFIFNPSYGPKEGEESQKILYYYPRNDSTDVQVRNIGLIEGIINFTSTFKVNSDFTSLHTQKTRQLILSVEDGFYMVLVLNIPKVTKIKDSVSNTEYAEDDIQDKVYEQLLRHIYYMYRLFWNTFTDTLKTQTVEELKKNLDNFYSKYFLTLKLEHSDILSIFCGIQYLPLDKLTFLKVQCLINSLECNFPKITQTAFLYNEHLIWSGVEPSDMQIIYQYLINTIIPESLKEELQGGSMPRNASPFAALTHGKFITGPTNLKRAKTVGKIPKIHTFSGPKAGAYHCIIYRALSASLCIFKDGDEELTLDFFKELDNYLNPKFTALVSEIAEYCSKQILSPIPENSPKFIYFNRFNLAYKSTIHSDNKKSGNVSVNDEQLKIVADINANNPKSEGATETVVKTLNESWVVSKTSNYREFYVVEQQRNAHLIDISKDVQSLCESELKGIFFQPL